MGTTSNKLNKKLCMSLTWSCLFFILAASAHAGTYYVSPNGVANWTQAVNINTPCSVVTAMTNAKAGDIVYFRGGTYIAGQSNNNSNLGYWNPTNSGTASNPIIFMAYPEETPIMDAYVSGSSTDYVSRALGNGHKNYIIFDGFTLRGDDGDTYGSLVIAGEGSRAEGCQVKNCTFIGASTEATTTDNVTGLFMRDTTYTTVVGCVFDDYRQQTNWGNTSAVKMYYNDHCTIKNCNFNNCTGAIYDKCQGDYNTYSYNWIYNCYNGIYFQDYSVRSHSNISIHNNVIVNSGYRAINFETEDGQATDVIDMFHNTIYNSNPTAQLVNIGRGASRRIHSNIFVGNCSTAQYRFVYTPNDLVESDYNQFGPSVRIYKNTTYSTLSAWKTSSSLYNGTNPDTHSLASDPRFVNVSGKMNQIKDFQLRNDSPCKGTGKNGTDIGADISLVGSGIESPETDRTPPAEPTGINVQPQIQ